MLQGSSYIRTGHDQAAQKRVAPPYMTKICQWLKVCGVRKVILQWYRSIRTNCEI